MGWYLPVVTEREQIPTSECSHPSQVAMGSTPSFHVTTRHVQLVNLGQGLRPAEYTLKGKLLAINNR